MHPTALVAATGPDPYDLGAIVISLFALAAAVGSVIYTRRQAVAAEQANRLDTSARLRVIVRNRRETRNDGFLGDITTRWEFQNTGRVTARRVEITVVVPGYTSPHLAPFKADEIAPGESVVVDMPTPYVPSLAEVTLAKADRGLDVVYADAEWRDDREGIQAKRIEVEQLGEVNPKRADGEVWRP